MKRVLLIDGSTMFTEFLRDKLKSEQISLDVGIGSRDAFTKLIVTLPDLVIIEIKDNVSNDILELLEKKHIDVNAKKIPIIMTGPEIDHMKIATLAEYGVIKYFKKPIRFDIFFETISHILKMEFFMDDTPCLIDIHLNGEIIFIEISSGLNREKFYLLKYKISEIITKNNLRIPKVILMLTNLQLSFMDAVNIELLLDNIIADPRIEKSNVKVLSLNDFVKELINGHPQYNKIEVSSSLTDILNGFVESTPSLNISDFVEKKILNSDKNIEEGDFSMGFDSSHEQNDGNELTIAVVDDDVVVRKLLQNAFSSVSAKTFLFSSGTEYLKSISEKKEYDLTILDLFIPDMDGFTILKSLQNHSYSKPIIIYSQATQKEAVLQAMTLGAKSYLVKPQKPAVIVGKALEILRNSN